MRYFRLSPQYKFPIKGFIETSFIDWPGKLASVLFTGGCNFRCPFCHNGDLVLRHTRMPSIPNRHVMATLRRFSKWVNRVVVTGGEPTLQPGLPDFLQLLKNTGFLIKLDTNGSNPDLLKDLAGKGLIDYVAMDVKGPLARYERWCGVHVDVGKIEESIKFLLEGSIDYEFRMTLVPFLHREQDAYDAAEGIKSARRFVIQTFIPRDTLNPAYAQVKPFLPEKMTAIRAKVRYIMGHAEVARPLHH
jgi:pyruvate formate lyase activating enzyme